MENPNPFNVKISSLQYTILLNNITIAEGWDSDVILKQGTTIVDYISDINMSRIPDWWSSYISHGETTHIDFEYTVKASAGPIHQTKTITESYGTVDTDFLSTLRLDQPHDITVPLRGQDYHLLTATDFTADWDNITQQTITINATVDLYNPQDSAITVDTFTYYFNMNNLTVGHGHLSHPITLPPYETTSVACDTIIDNNDLIQWFTSHIQHNETTHYEIGTSATFTYNGQQHTAEPINFTGKTITDMLD
ncbi:MAG: LEA type 2 family protein [Thermoplasmatota archaeon]